MNNDDWMLLATVGGVIVALAAIFGQPWYSNFLAEKAEKKKVAKEILNKKKEFANNIIRDYDKLLFELQKCFSLYSDQKYEWDTLEEAHKNIWERKEFVDAFENLFSHQKNINYIFNNENDPLPRSKQTNNERNLNFLISQVPSEIDKLKSNQLYAIKDITNFKMTDFNSIAFKWIRDIKDLFDRSFLFTSLEKDTHPLWLFKNNSHNIKQWLLEYTQDSQK